MISSIVNIHQHKALISVGSFTPVLVRECSSIPFTIASARLPWWFIFSSLVFKSVIISSSVFAYLSSVGLNVHAFSSSNISLFTSEKLFTKFKGFCISCAMPAVSSPRLAIFSDWISCDCVDFKI